MKKKLDLELLAKHDLYQIEGPQWVKAKKGYFIDSDGYKWIDMTSGILTANTGHNNKKVIKSIMKPLRDGIVQSWYRPSEYRLNAHLTLQKVLPKNYTKAIFLVTGSEAVEQALKIAKHFIGDKDIISFTYNYHGSTNMASSMNMIREEHLQLKSPICCKGYCPYGKDKYEGCGKECFEKSVKNLKNPGAVIFSPYLGAYSTWMPDDYYLAFIKWVRENNIFTIDDEVQSGFFRTGIKCFGIENRECYFEPDLILGGKGATALLPLSFLSINNKIKVPIDDYFSTHSGNPACLSALVSAIDFYIENNIGLKVDNMGLYLQFMLRKLRQKYSNIIMDNFGQGLAQSLLFVNNEQGKKLVHEIFVEMRNRHILFMDTERPVIKFVPPLVITKKQIDKTINELDKVIGELYGTN
jgi:4-aminobutyrate aminotransferase-like enzyme